MGKYAIDPQFEKACRIPAFKSRLGIAFVDRQYHGLFDSEVSVDVPGVKIKIVEIKTAASPMGSVRCLLYTPDELKSKTQILFCHGGGLVFPALPYHFRFARAMAKETGCRVLMPDYHLAPKYRMPVQGDECYDCYLHLTADGDPVILVGDSAGGGTAAAIALMARDRKAPATRAMMLLYPCTDQRLQTKSMREFKDTPICNSRAVVKYYKLTTDKNYSGEIAYISPMLAESLAGMPPTYVETAEFDCLRDEGIAFAERLKEEGTETELFNTKGTMHAFDMAKDSEIVKEAFERRIGYLKKFI